MSIEAKLRHPVEFYSSAALLFSILAMAAYSDLFALNPELRYPIAAGALTLAVWRAYQGYQVEAYKRNLRVLKRYVLKAEEIPHSKDCLYLGMGFRWTQQHTQRLHDSRLPKNLKYRKPSIFYKSARAFEKLTETDPRFFKFRDWANKTRSLHPWNPVAIYPDVGGDPALHGVEPMEIQVSTSLANRQGNMMVLGTTGVGKTRMAEYFVTQDIRRGEVVIFVDPKGDLAMLRRMYAEAKRCGRHHNFHIFHLGYPEISCRYNPIGAFSRVTQVATRMSDPLPSEGNSAAFKEFVWRFVNVLSKAMVELGERPDYNAIREYAVDTEKLAVRYWEKWLDRVAPSWRDQLDLETLTKDKTLLEQAKKTGRSIYTLGLMKYIRDKALREPVSEALMSVMVNDRTYFEKLVSSLYPLLEKLTTGKVASIISPVYDDLEDSRPIIDWMNIINSKGIVYVGLDSLSDHEVASAVGTAMFADLTAVAGEIYKHGVNVGQAAKDKTASLDLHADEFNELVGDAFIPMVNKARGAGYRVTAYTQTGTDVEAKSGSAPKAQQIFGNFNSLVMLRVQSTETAEYLTNRLQDVEVSTLVASTSASDTNDPSDFAEFSSKNEDRISTERVPMLTASDLTQLPKGQAFALIDGGQLYKIRIPLLDENDDAFMPKDLDSLVQELDRDRNSKATYATELTTEGSGGGW